MKLANTLNHISTITKLKDLNKINDQNLICIGNLQLEELIAVKLELSSQNINKRLYGFDIWRRTAYIVRDGILKFSLSVAKSKKDAARFLGIPFVEFKNHIRDYKTSDYFKEEQKND